MPSVCIFYSYSCKLFGVFYLSINAEQCPLGVRNQVFIYRKQTWIMSCNATVVTVNSLEARDQSKQDWAPDQSCWQTQHCCSATVSLTHTLFLFSLSAEAWAIFSPSSFFLTAPTNTITTLHLSPHNSSLHINPTWASVLTSNLNPMYFLNDLLWSLHSAPSLPSLFLISDWAEGQRECW